MITAHGTENGSGRDFEVWWADGDVSGTAWMVNEITLRRGTVVWVTPSGPALILDRADDASMCALLRELSTDVRFAGPVPPVPKLPPGALG